MWHSQAVFPSHPLVWPHDTCISGSTCCHRSVVASSYTPRVACPKPLWCHYLPACTALLHFIAIRHDSGAASQIRCGGGGASVGQTFPWQMISGCGLSTTASSRGTD